MGTRLITTSGTRILFVLLIFISGYLPGESVGGLGWKSGQTNSCASHNDKLLAILNIMCNVTQTTSIQTRDACYGCFFRAAAISGAANQILSLSQCANLYLPNTEYAPCAAQIQTAGAIPLTAAGCNNGYCNFVRCVRRINANNLVDACFLESLANRTLATEADRVGFYMNVTSCILTRTRCNAYNPITGELQNRPVQAVPIYGLDKLLGGLHKHQQRATALYNSLQISASGDIRIVSFPANVNVADTFCTRSSSLNQAGFGSLSC